MNKEIELAGRHISSREDNHIEVVADENMKDIFDKNCKPALQMLCSVLNEFLYNGWIQKFY